MKYPTEPMPGTVPACNWVNRYPVFWINLQRETTRRKRMRAALSTGNWEHCRWNATDGSHPRRFGRDTSLASVHIASDCNATVRQILTAAPTGWNWPVSAAGNS